MDVSYWVVVSFQITYDSQTMLLILNDVNPHPANLIYIIFHPLEVVSRYPDPQLQVGGNYLFV